MRNIATVSDIVARPPSRAARLPLAWLARLARYERVAFAAVILVHLVPVWAFAFLPTTDGAAHVANADVMRKYGDPALEVFRTYYYVSSDPSPNLAGHLLLAAFLYVLPPVAAEKLLISLYVVLFPLAVRYAIRAVRPKAAPLAFLALPLTYSYLFAQGFYNFCLSIPAFFFIVGYWIRNRDRMDLKRGLGLFGLSIVLYACHLFSLMMACGVIGMLAAWFSHRELWVDRRAAIRRVVVSGVALLPAVASALAFRPGPPQYMNTEIGEWSLKDDLLSLAQFRAMVSYRDNESILGGGVVTVFAGLVLVALGTKIFRRSWNRWDVLLLVPAGLFAVYLKAHDPAAVHFYIPQRTMYYLFLTLILWLAGQPMTRGVRWMVPPLAVVLAMGFVASHALKYREFAPQLREFVSAGDRIRSNSTFLPLIFAPQGANAQGRPSSIDVAPFYMASGYIAVRRDAVDLRNYEAKTDHFPVRFRDEINPYKHLAIGQGLDRIPPRIDLGAFAKAGGRVDYVLLWGSEAQRRQEGTEALYQQLESGYRRVDLPNSPRTELWERR